MWEFLTGRSMQRVVAVSALFAILTTLDLHWDDSRWWCVVALLLVLDHISHAQGMQEATTNLFLMNKFKLMKLKDFVDEAVKGRKTDPETLLKILKEKEGNDE